jgi:hypothetical protein
MLSVLSALQDLRTALTTAPQDDVTLPAYPGAHPFVPEIVANLPPPLRDHLLDRYLRALQR